MLRLLYLFKHINKRQPFTISLKIDRKYILQLAKLASYLQLPLGNLLQAYKTDPNHFNEMEQFFKDIKVYDSLEQIVANQPGKTIYVYPEKKEDLPHFERIACLHQNVHICSDFLSRIFQNNPRQIHRIDQLNRINAFLD